MSSTERAGINSVGMPEKEFGKLSSVISKEGEHLMGCGARALKTAEEAMMMHTPATRVASLAHRALRGLK